MASTTETAPQSPEDSPASAEQQQETKTPKNEFDKYIVRTDDSGIYRKCPYCGKEIWDGAHNTRASGFAFHLNVKAPGHSDKPEWKARYGKNSWTLSSHSDE
jgi:hypothetical protein